MPYCNQCGSFMLEGTAFCQKCGQRQDHGGTLYAQRAPADSGLSQNTVALLSYVLGWVTGLIFFFIDKRPYVRFHAAQSIVTFGGLHILKTLVGMALGVGWWFGGMRHMSAIPLAWLIMSLIGILSFVLWIILMVKAYQGARFKLPLAGDVAENLAGR